MEGQKWESGEESIDETGRNPTQRRIDEEVAPESGDSPVDADWEEEPPEDEPTPT